MSGLLPNVDPDGLLEFSGVYTDRALNHMSKSFHGVMTDISSILKAVYNAHSSVLVAFRQFAAIDHTADRFAFDL